MGDIADQYEGEAIGTASDAELASLGARRPTSRSRIEIIDQSWMTAALVLADKAKQAGMRPFGCIIVAGRTPLGTASGSETPTDPTRHSEILAIQQACESRGGLLLGTTLYSTHEPCVMCCGAIMHAKISRVVFGSYRADLPDLFRQRSNGTHPSALLCDTSVPVKLTGGVLREQCIALFDDERRKDAR